MRNVLLLVLLLAIPVQAAEPTAKAIMTKPSSVVCLTLFVLAGGAIAQEHDYYKSLRYPQKLVPGVGRSKVEQEGGPDAAGYKRRTVHWWPRKGQDIVDIPKGAPGGEAGKSRLSGGSLTQSRLSPAKENVSLQIKLDQ